MRTALNLDKGCSCALCSSSGLIGHIFLPLHRGIRSNHALLLWRQADTYHTFTATRTA